MKNTYRLVGRVSPLTVLDGTCEYLYFC